MREINGQIYKIKRAYSGTRFVEADDVSEVARYIARNDKKGYITTSVTEVNIDGTTPRIAVKDTKAYKDAMIASDPSGEKTQLCNLEVDVQMQPNGKFDVYINQSGDSGYHYADVTADEIGRLVAEEVAVRAEARYA